MSELTQDNRDVAIGTPLGKDLLLFKRMSGMEAVSQPFEFKVQMVSTDPEIKFEDLMGENVTVRLNHLESETPRFFNGIVADFCQLEPRHSLNEYEATIVPWLWFLKKVSDCRIFQQLSLPDILSDVFKAHGFEDFELRLSETYPKLDYCVQYRETDFDFVSRLMEEVGIYYFFIHENGKHTLVLADSTAAHDPCPEFDEMRYVGPTQNTVGSFDFVKWEMRKEVTTGGYSIRDFNFAEPKKMHLPDASNEFEHNLSQFTQYEYDGTYTEDGGKEPKGKIQFENFAKTRLNAIQSTQTVAYGKTASRGLISGHTFGLEGCYRPDQDRGHFILSAEHTIDVGDFYSTGVQADEFYTVEIRAIPDDVEFHPIPKTPKPKVAGPQTAMVVGRSGEEIDTDQFGRVKVQFHWDRESKADETSSCWIRVSQNWAGKKWGAFFIPRIGQEVIVDFLEGDPDRPIVTGRVYNGDAMPPYELPKEKTKSTIKSNSSKGGEGFNEIRFEDKKDDEQIFVHAEKDIDLRVLNDHREAIMGNMDLRVGTGEKGEGDVGNRSAWIEMNDQLLVLKDRLEMIEGEHHETTVGDNFQKTDGDQHLTVGGDNSIDVSGQISRKAGGDIQEKSGGNYAMDAGSAIHIKAGKTIVLEAGMQISLKVGGNFVDIGPAGVSIKGAMVLVNSGGAAGAGAGSSPKKPKAPSEPPEAVEADDDKAGAIATVTGTSYTRKTAKLSSYEVALSPAAQVLVDASESGAPFCEQCEKAKKEMEDQKG
ncbi:MAG: type VI secretion system Vgr family protein [Opitutaceae bacterium]